MFQRLTDFSYQRTVGQAIGFYVAYVLAVLILGELLAGILKLLGGALFLENVIETKIMVTVMFSAGISFWILKRKSLWGNWKYVLLGILAGVIALLVGILGGLLPAAYLTTKNAKQT